MSWKDTLDRWDTWEIVIDVIIATAVVIILGSVWYRFCG